MKDLLKYKKSIAAVITTVLAYLAYATSILEQIQGAF